MSPRWSGYWLGAISGFCAAVALYALMVLSSLSAQAQVALLGGNKEMVVSQCTGEIHADWRWIWSSDGSVKISRANPECRETWTGRCELWSAPAGQGGTRLRNCTQAEDRQRQRDAEVEVKELVREQR
jgi:hypothetical protein